MRDNNKDDDVMCWNCFTVDNVENEKEPISLKKVRIQQREKLKVYPFLASEISKPKTVALKQKLSSHYQIGKKNSDKIHKIRELHGDGIISEPQINKALKQQEENSNETNEKKYVTPETGSCKSDIVDKCFEDNDNDKAINIQFNQFVISDETKRNTKEVNEEMFNSNKSSVLDATSTGTEKDDGNINKYKACNELTNAENDNNLDNLALEIDKNPVINDKVFHSTKVSVSCDKPTTGNIGAGTTNLQQTSTHTNNIINTASKSAENKSFSQYTPPKSAISRIPLKIERLTPESNKKIFNPQFEAPKTNESPSKDIKDDQIKSSSPKLGKTASDTTVKKKSESFLKYLGVSKKKYQEPLKNKGEPSISIEDEIKNINFKMSALDLNEIDDTDNQTSEKITVKDNKERTEKNTTQSGSKTQTLKDDYGENTANKSLQLRTKSVENVKPRIHKDTSRNEKVFTSLSSLSNLPTLSSLSKSSTPIKKPAKALRWSTLSMPARKFSFEDDIYISDTSTTHHGATLPRRSNSPLPHERDFDRERFQINRSGLQARSESMASVYSGAGEARGGVAVRGEVQFSLLYNYRLGALEVGVRGCRDLAPVDVKRNRSDPYVKVYLLPDKSKSGKRKTKVKKNTLSPVFEETLSFIQPLAAVAARTLWLSVWHADMFGRNDFLGEVRLPLADIVFDDPAPVWYKLHERTEQFDEQQGSRGDLIIGLKLELPDPRGKGNLRVLVKEAKNLVATKPNGLADVFCKSYLLPERGRLGKQKTGVCRRSLSPRWDHELVYRGVTSQQLATRALELSLWDRDRLASNDFMGAVRLSLGTGTYMGATVNWMDSVGKEVTLWQTMLDGPNFWVEGSLPLRPQLNN